jgi:hypothetical protein
MTTILKNLVTKTAMANSVKLSAPADRIGLGLVAVATYPAEVLSSGQFPLPPSPDSEPNPGGSRQELSAELMREHQPAMATARPPVGSTGRSVPGSSAHRWPRSFMQPLALRGCAQATKRQPATGRLTSLPTAAMSRMSFPAAAIVRERIGDCQSPDRRDDRRAAMSWETTPTAAAAI